MVKRALLVSRNALGALILLLAGAVAGLALHVATANGDTVFSWKRPGNLGVKDGRLAPPKRTPNSVSSQADAADSEHYIAPIPFKGDALSAMAAVRKAVNPCMVHRLRHDGLPLCEFRTKLCASWMT